MTPRRFHFALFSLLPLLVVAGCTTGKTSHTPRTAKEQLLISNSVDQSLDKIDFRPFGGYQVFLEDKYLECVDKNYIVGSIRHRLLYAGAALAPKAEEADIILEARSGGVGTNHQESFVGVPELSVPGPFPISTPEVRVLSRDTQTGIAKLGLVAYDAKTGTVLGSGGTSLARSDDNNWFFLGMGPYQHGSIHREAERGLELPGQRMPLPNQVAFERPEGPLSPLRLAGSTDEEQGSAELASPFGERPQAVRPDLPNAR
jgi:hypothetical protein